MLSDLFEGQTSRLSAAALETLAIVAYKQPISRMQISAIAVSTLTQSYEPYNSEDT